MGKLNAGLLSIVRSKGGLLSPAVVGMSLYLVFNKHGSRQASHGLRSSIFFDLSSSFTLTTTIAMKIHVSYEPLKEIALLKHLPSLHFIALI